MEGCPSLTKWEILTISQRLATNEECSRARSILEDCASEKRAAAEGGVEAIEGHYGHQQNCGESDARIPRRTLGRQGKVQETKSEDYRSYQRQQAEADQQEHAQTIKDQPDHHGNGSRPAPREQDRRVEKDGEEKNECDRCRPLLTQQGAEKEQDKERRKRYNKRNVEAIRYMGNDGARPQKRPLWTVRHWL